MTSSDFKGNVAPEMFSFKNQHSNSPLK